jgi:hypothetical protein
MKTFELKIIINVKTEEGLENIDHLKQSYQDKMRDKIAKAKSTIKEIK